MGIAADMQEIIGCRKLQMKLPIRNYLQTPLTLFIEPYCHEHKIPAGGEAIITLEDGRPHSIDIHPERWVSLWDTGSNPIAMVEIYPDQHPSRAS